MIGRLRHRIFVDHPPVPLDVFNTVTENLLENARSKRLSQPDITITVSLQAGTEGIGLDVTDSGTALAGDTVSRLFNEVILSENGFGIGLYQSSQLARRAGYQLSLDSNTAGSVSFRLATG